MEYLTITNIIKAQGGAEQYGKTDMEDMYNTKFDAIKFNTTEEFLENFRESGNQFIDGTFSEIVPVMGKNEEDDIKNADEDDNIKDVIEDNLEIDENNDMQSVRNDDNDEIIDNDSDIVIVGDEDDADEDDSVDVVEIMDFDNDKDENKDKEELKKSDEIKKDVKSEFDEIQKIVNEHHNLLT